MNYVNLPITAGTPGPPGPTGPTGPTGPAGPPGTTDHLALTNIGTNTHAQIDTALTRLVNTSGTNTGDATVTTEGSLILGAISKTTPVDADLIGLSDSAASNVLKSLSWLNLKATLKTYFDTIYITATLLYFAESRNTTTPNATIPTHSFIPKGSETNIDVLIGPKGTGSFVAQIPDNLASGGNKRGANAVDLQVSRTANTQVASGDNSYCSGANNTASNTGAYAVGLGNIASGVQSLAIGFQNNASGGQSICLGYQCAANNASSIAMGSSSVATGQSSIGLGGSASATGDYTFASGLYASTFGVIGRRTHSSGFNGAVSDSQHSRFGLRNSTTNATATRLSTASGSIPAASVSNQVLLQNNQSFYFKGEIIGKQSGSLNSAVFKVEGLIVRGTTAATTTLVTSAVTTYSNVPAWGTPTLTADTTLGSLNISVAGLAATNIRWMANIETTEVIYA